MTAISPENQSDANRGPIRRTQQRLIDYDGVLVASPVRSERDNVMLSADGVVYSWYEMFEDFRRHPIGAGSLPIPQNP
jgi:hypothetical protein